MSELSLIYQLQQKHRLSSVSDLLKLQESLQDRAIKTNNLDELLSSTKENYSKPRMNFARRQKPSANRGKKVATSLCKQLISLLKELGIPEAQMEIDQRSTEQLHRALMMLKSCLARIRVLAVRR